MLAAGTKLLRQHYTLDRLVPGRELGTDQSETWIAVGPYESEYLVRLWQFDGDQPDLVKRALWDAELRTLYRVASSPGAADSLMELKDAGVDMDARAFVMVLEARGYERLSAHLKERTKIPWLGARDPLTKIELWRAFRRLAEGIDLLHQQRVIHRDVNVDNVFFSSAEGPSSLRLGGFEWSVRVGGPSSVTPAMNWSSPPEFFEPVPPGYQPEIDWFGFGVLVARCLVDLERHAKNAPRDRYANTLETVSKSTRDLTERERDLLGRLLARDPLTRVRRAYEIIASIDDIISYLESGRTVGALEDLPPHLLAIRPQDRERLVDAAIEAGYVPNDEEPNQAYSHNSPMHVARLTSFLQHDLVDAVIYALPGGLTYLLVGKTMGLIIAAFKRVGESRETWDTAYCVRAGKLFGGAREPLSRELGDRKVTVRTIQQVNRDKSLQQQSESWERSLPVVREAVRLRAALDQFHDFVRCTNQMELLIRDAEIFQYKVVERAEDTTTEWVTIEELERDRAPLFPVQNGMADFLLAEKESKKQNSDKVILNDLDTGGGLMPPSVPPTDRWQIESADLDTRRVRLGRPRGSLAKQPAPPEGFVRAFGMYGQVDLIRRRKSAIDRLPSHSYLLRALVTPTDVYMDTGENPVRLQLPEDKVDESKRACIGDVLRVRPVYALQGPPGTGKTTMVAWLLREIFREDPVAQVLVTATSHPAVDVLRDKVRNEAFENVPIKDQPLAVRLRGRNEDVIEGSVEWVSREELRSTLERLTECPTPTPQQQEWMTVVRDMIEVLEAGSTDPDVTEFCELVKRAASITYCTTSASELEVLAKDAHTFDWSILEEAGKAHGFDLALPLQAGHRWLLIGDQNQLRPYRDHDYSDGIANLVAVVEALKALPERGGGLVDQDWLRSWELLSDASRSEFRDYAKRWLHTFEEVYRLCESAPSAEPQTTGDTEENGAAAGMLSRQHRMHKDIGDLISTVFYHNRIISRTGDETGMPQPKFRHGLSTPSNIANKAIVWINTPWVGKDPNRSFGEQGQRGFRNPGEAEALASFLSKLGSSPAADNETLDLAVLSPYALQTVELRRQLAGIRLPEFIRPKTRLGRFTSNDGAAPNPVHTVDSFQGNEADIVAVSLVRNNLEPEREGLGFLKEWRRLNVMVSRAERLLILVGSWDFFKHQVSLVDPEDQSDDLRYWWNFLSIFDSYIKDGRAVMYDAADIIGSTPAWQQ